MSGYALWIPSMRSRWSFVRHIAWVAAILLASAASAPAHAQSGDYPNRPVRVIVAFTAGGTTDILARAVGQKLSERFRQPFVIENRPGGGGNIGTEVAARAAPDGYTLIINSVGPIAVNPSLYKKLNINPLVDLVPVVQSPKYRTFSWCIPPCPRTRSTSSSPT